MRTNLHSYVAKAQGASAAAEQAVWRPAGRDSVLSRLARWGQEFFDLVLGLDQHNEANARSADVVAITASARIISDAASVSISPESDDLHDLTGHHRYYGNAA